MENNNSYHYLFKFVIIGESGVGKSCLVLNFTEQKPRRQHQVTIACEFASRTVDIDGKKIKVQIWDTAGQENFRSITRSYYKTAVAAVVVYDITCKKSFERVTNWLSELKDNAHHNVAIALVGNKLDLEKNREVSYQDGYNFAKANKLRFTETCAFELVTIEPLFKSMAEETLQKIQKGILNPKNEQLGVKVGDLTLKSQESSISTAASSKSGKLKQDRSLGSADKKKKKGGCC